MDNSDVQASGSILRHKIEAAVWYGGVRKGSDPSTTSRVGGSVTLTRILLWPTLLVMPDG